MARTIYLRCIYGIFGREIFKFIIFENVIYGVYIRFWPTLVLSQFKTAACLCTSEHVASGFRVCAFAQRSCLRASTCMWGPPQNDGRKGVAISPEATVCVCLDFCWCNNVCAVTSGCWCNNVCAVTSGCWCNNVTWTSVVGVITSVL